MKKITKKKDCKALTRWLQKQNGLNCTYEKNLDSDVREKVLTQLMREQGGMCCYTGVNIDESNAHIEHVYPQSLCKKEAGLKRLYGARRDVDYKNMLAAYPKDDSMKLGSKLKADEFGAKRRRNWYDEACFIHPLQARCEKSFIFDQFGGIHPAENENASAAKKTIEVLNLDHHLLREWRATAIDEFFFSDTGEPSEASLRRMFNDIYKRDRKGNYKPFCFVLEHVGKQLLRDARRDHIRRVAIQRQK